jgi:hypothetical protein
MCVCVVYVCVCVCMFVCAYVCVRDFYQMFGILPPRKCDCLNHSNNPHFTHFFKSNSPIDSILFSLSTDPYSSFDDPSGYTILTPYQHHAKTILTPYWHYAATILTPYQHHAKTILTPYWHYADTILTPYQHHAKTILTPYWHYADTILTL